MSIEGKGDATLKLYLPAFLEELKRCGLVDKKETRVPALEMRGYLRLREDDAETSTLFFIQAGTGKVLFEVVPDIKIIGILR